MDFGDTVKYVLKRTHSYVWYSTELTESHEDNSVIVTFEKFWDPGDLQFNVGNQFVIDMHIERQIM